MDKILFASQHLLRKKALGSATTSLLLFLVLAVLELELRQVSVRPLVPTPPPRGREPGRTVLTLEPQDNLARLLV